MFVLDLDLNRSAAVREIEDVGLTTELCGDLIDQDSSGSDLLCPGDDKDYDGFPADQDCDDENRYALHNAIARHI